MQRPRWWFTSIVVLSSPWAHAATTDPLYANTPWDVRNGAASVAASANYGKGIKFGVVDTGIVPSPWFSATYNGQGVNSIDTTKSAICLNGTCTGTNPQTSPNDTMGHGTFVASEIVGGIKSAGYAGVAPAGQVIPVKVFNSSGGASGVDVANGIRYAANAGANVINLSLGPSGGTAAQQAGFYSYLADAINAAAAKNSVVVFAAGNSAQAFAGNGTITGLTDAALARLLIVGSTNSSKTLSSFSNTAGTGKFVSTSGKTVSVSSLFIDAEGENILGASNYNGPGCTGYMCATRMSGTSMAAPLVTGGIGLLEARWPVLIRNGTATQVLTKTATDLGAAGTDSTYGTGFMNLDNAFKPIGTLNVPNTKGTLVPVSSITGQMITSGAFGNLSTISSKLANYSAFDTYSRDFGVNLSGLITTKPTTSSAASAATKTSKVGTTKFADGSSLTLGLTEQAHVSDGFVSDPSRNENPGMMASFSDASGHVTAMGYGFPASASFANALWGTDSNTATLAQEAGASGSTFSLAEGGSFAAYGTPIGGGSRVAFSWAQTQSPTDSPLEDRNKADARALAVGFSTSVTPAWKTGLTVSLLDENQGMLGSTYRNSPVSFGNQHTTGSVGVSTAVKLDKHWDFVADAAIARTDGGEVSDSLITHVSETYARSYGASFVRQDTFDAGDRLSFDVKAPLRVMSGHASLTTSGVDADGNPVTGSTRVGLAPTGSELKFGSSYHSAEKEGLSWNATLEASQDAGNVRGETDVTGFVGGKYRF